MQAVDAGGPSVWRGAEHGALGGAGSRRSALVAPHVHGLRSVVAEVRGIHAPEPLAARPHTAGDGRLAHVGGRRTGVHGLDDSAVGPAAEDAVEGEDGWAVGSDAVVGGAFVCGGSSLAASGVAVRVHPRENATRSAKVRMSAFYADVACPSCASNNGDPSGVP